MKTKPKPHRNRSSVSGSHFFKKFMTVSSAADLIPGEDTAHLVAMRTLPVCWPGVTRIFVLEGCSAEKNCSQRRESQSIINLPRRDLINRAILALILGCVFPAATGAAQKSSAGWTNPSADPVNAIYPEVESLYLDLHRYPELAMHEQQTAAKLAERIKALGYEVTTSVGGTGVVAVLRNGPGRTVLLRTDMDALPIEEATGLPFASHVVVKTDSGTSIPVMHACGHPHVQLDGRRQTDGHKPGSLAWHLNSHRPPREKNRRRPPRHD